MKKMMFIIVGILFVIFLGLIFSSRVIGSVYIKDYNVKENKMTLNVGVLSSSGYVRKLKGYTRDNKYYIKFYSTYGINNKFGSKDNFEINIENIEEIYLYGDNKEYRLVLKKNEEGKWERNNHENRNRY